MDYISMINEAKEYLKSRIHDTPDVAVVLGTGLGELSNHIENRITIKYSEIPHFPVSTVAGHAGEFIYGNIADKKVIAMNGRFHFYEGYEMSQVTFPVRVLRALGIGNLIVTNAAGGMNPDFKAGDLMIITDHINMLGANPLIGKNYDELGPRFPDMSEAYSRDFVKLAQNTSDELGIKVQSGVYVAVTGPNYETPAELKMLRYLGADAVGMSTVPEVIAAAHSEMKVLGISCITDMAIAEGLEPLDHEKVMETAKMATEKFVKLVKNTIIKM